MRLADWVSFFSFFLSFFLSFLNLFGLERLGRGGVTYSEDVGHAEDADDDAGGDDEAPEGRAEGALGGGLFVQVAEDGDPDDDHDDAEGDESVGRGEERPVVGGVALEERDLGEYEEDCSFGKKRIKIVSFVGLLSRDGMVRIKRGNSLLTQPVIRWLTPSKKKNFETTKVLTSMTKLAATTARRAITFITRMTLSTT